MKIFKKSERGLLTSLIRYLTCCGAVFFWALFIILLAWGGTSQAKDVLKIGVFVPLTGPAAEVGQFMKCASILALEEINKAGGILGRKIELFIEDDESKPPSGASVLERLINRDKVDILVGGLNSNVGLAVMEIAAKYEIPMILSFPATYKITEKIIEEPHKYRYIIKTNPSTRAYGIIAKDFIVYLEKNNLVKSKKKTAATICEHTEWGRGMSDSTTEELSKIGWKVVANEVHDIGETNFISLLSKVKALAPEFLVIGQTSGSGASSLSKQFLEQNLQMYLLGGYGPQKPGFIEAVGKSGEGICTMGQIMPYGKKNDEFEAKYVKRWGHKTDVTGPVQYDMIYLIKESYERVGSFDKNEFMKAILESKKEGTVGRYVFDKASHESKSGRDFIPGAVQQLQGGEWRFLLPEHISTSKFMRPVWLK